MYRYAATPGSRVTILGENKNTKSIYFRLAVIQLSCIFCDSDGRRQSLKVYIYKGNLMGPKLKP